MQASRKIAAYVTFLADVGSAKREREHPPVRTGLNFCDTRPCGSQLSAVFYGAFYVIILLECIMKKLTALLLIFINLLTLCLVSCTPEDDRDDDALNIDVTESGYKIICESGTAVSRATAKLIEKVEKETGVTLGKIKLATSQSKREIIIGNLEAREESAELSKKFEPYATERIAVSAITLSEEKIVVGGSNSAGLDYAVRMLMKYVDGGKFLVPADLDELVIFDSYTYTETDEPITFTLESLAAFTGLATLSVGGEDISVKDIDTYENTYNIDYPDKYPTIAATAGAKGGSVTVEQASDTNGSVATVTSKSSSGEKSTVYKFNFNVSDTYSVNAEIVNKGGAKGTVTLVFDDGDTSSATYIKNTVTSKYPTLTASFALIMNKLATLNEVEDNGEHVWETDKDGNYVNTKDESVFNFWESLLADNRFEAISHSFTHTYPGNDDNGGIYDYKDYGQGNWHKTPRLPKGNLTMELNASAQILRELNQRGITFVIPGVGANLPAAFYDLLRTNGTYIGARGVTYGITKPDMLKDISKRYDIASYAIEYYGAASVTNTTKASTPKECLNAGIDKWQAYIDDTIKEGGWGCFLVHNVRDDSYTNRYEHFIYKSQADKLFNYLYSKGDDVWVATYTDAQIYYNQWSTSTVSAEAYKDEYVMLTHSDMENGEIYNMAMTVKVSVPETWTGAKVGDIVYEVKTADDGTKFIYVDILPDSTIKIDAVK